MKKLKAFVRRNRIAEYLSINNKREFMMKSILAKTIVANAMFMATAPGAYSSDNICTTTEERARIVGFYEGVQKPLPLFAARKLGLTEAKIVTGLSGVHTVAADPGSFPELWGQLQDFEEVFFLIFTSGSFFEIHSELPAGEPSSRSSYFNLERGVPLGGHINQASLAAIYSLHLPQENGKDIYAITFYDKKGNQVFGVYLSGEGRVASEQNIARFNAITGWLKKSPLACAE